VSVGVGRLAPRASQLWHSHSTPVVLVAAAAAAVLVLVSLREGMTS
jgi:hypothetical protein